MLSRIGCLQKKQSSNIYFWPSYSNFKLKGKNIFVKLQVLGLGLGVDFVFPLSQEEQQEEQQEPPPKFLERNSTRG